MSKYKIDLTSGSAVKKVFLLSWPMIISNLLHVLYNLADTLWLGILGKEEVAAMAFVFPIVFFIISIGIGLAIAASVLVSQYEGAGQKKNVNQIVGQTFSLAIVVALFISALGLIFSGPVVSFLGAEGNVSIYAVKYLKIMFYGVFFMFGFFIFNSIMRGWGNTRTPMRIMVVSNLINIILDPLLIFGYGIFPEMGVEGAAVATVFSRLLATFAGLYILIKRKDALKLTIRSLVPDFLIWKKIFRIGWPITIEHALRAFGMMLITAIVAKFGTVYTAAYAIGLRVFSLFIMPMFAVSMGVAASVGQNLGAGLKQRAVKLTFDMMWIMTLGVLVVSALLFFFRYDIAGIFLKNDTSGTIHATVTFLSRLALAAPFLGIAFVMRGGFKGAGRTVQSMLISNVGLLGIRVPIAYFLSRYINGVQGIWDSFIIGSFLEALICIIYYYKSDWAIPVIEGLDQKRIQAEQPDVGI